MPCRATNLRTRGTGRRRVVGLALIFAAGLAAGCQRLDTIVTLVRTAGLEFHYTGDGARSPDWASVSSPTCVIAQARRLNPQPNVDAAIAEIEIEETHFPACSPQVIYTGRVVFRCGRGEEFCTPVRTTPLSGSRPRNVFFRWPTSMGFSAPQAPPR
jgi:hypothetical protein